MNVCAGENNSFGIEKHKHDNLKGCGNIYFLNLDY